MTLEEVRAGIDAVDTQMKPLFLKRMECGKHVAEVKAQTGGDVFVLEENLKSLKKEPRMWIRRSRKNIKHS
ncbi:MAG: chorismate mutase [Dorea longicatena]